MRVLFVCTGNIFRSLSAEHALRGALSRIDAVVSSAGTQDFPHVVRPSVREYLKLKGYDVSAHQRRTLTSGILEASDLVIAMSTDHQAFIERTFRVRVPLYTEACGEAPAPLPDIDDVIPDYQHNNALHEAAADAHIRLTIDRIVELAPRMASALDKLLQTLPPRSVT